MIAHFVFGVPRDTGERDKPDDCEAGKKKEKKIFCAFTSLSEYHVEEVTFILILWLWTRAG